MVARIDCRNASIVLRRDVVHKPAYKSVPAGGTILKDITVRPALALTMLAGMVSGISAFIIGLIAIIKQKERALLVYGASLIRALLILFLLGEVLSSH